MTQYRPGPFNSLTDIPGLAVGHAVDDGAGTGVTAIVCDAAFPAACDVRGGAPASRELAALDPENLMGCAHGFMLAGGSVFGLAAADGMAATLSARGVGVRLYDGVPPAPVVPALALYDLSGAGNKNWGQFPPYRDLGALATGNARADRPVPLGRVGAGLGARAGLLPGGIGSASLDLGEGLRVAALVAINPVGSVLMPDGRTFWAWPWERDGEFGGQRPDAGLETDLDPLPLLSRLAAGRPRLGANTTIGLVATNARLSAAQCRRLAIMAQDGIARAIRPAHTPFDGDALFAVATGEQGAAGDPALHLARLGSAAADCVARAIARGVWESCQGRIESAGQGL